jgi:hypothetical protein
MTTDKVEQEEERTKIIDPDKEEIEKRTNWENIVYIIFTFLFITAIFLQLNVTDSFKVYDTLYHLIDSPKQVLGNVDFDAPNDLMDQILKQICMKNFTFGDQKYEVVGSIRITQRRLKKIDVELNPLIKKIPYVMLGPDIDPESYFDENENTDAMKGFNFTIENSYKNYGGFVISFNKSDYNNSDIPIKDKYKNLNDTFNTVFYDDYSSCLVFDFTIINREINYVVVVVIEYILSSYGMSYGYFNCNILDYSLFSGSLNYFRTFLELLCFLILFYYTFYLFVTIKKRIDYISKNDNRIERQNKNEERDSHPNLTSDHKLTDENKKPKFFQKNFLKYLAQAVLSSIPNILQIISLILSLVCLIFWGVFAFKYLSNSTTFEDAINEGRLELSNQNNLIFLCESLRKYQSLLLFNFLICFLRLVNIFVQIFKNSQIFLDTLHKAAEDIFSFMAFFITVVFGFAVFTMVFYGRKIIEFGDFYICCQNILSYALGIIEIELVNKMVDFSILTTLIFFVCVIISLRLIVTKVLLAIIVHYFTITYDEQEFSKTQEEKNKVLNKEGIGRSKIAEIIDNIKSPRAYLKNLFRNKNIDSHKGVEDIPKLNSQIYNREYNQISQDDDDDDEDSKDIREYNKEYDEDYIFSLKNPYFDAEKDKIKLKEYYEDKNRKAFLKSILFICFLVSLILKNMFLIRSPWLENYFLAIQKFYESTGYDTFQKTNSRADPITDISEVRNFVFDILPHSFNYLTTDRYSPKPNSTQNYEFMKLDFKISDTIELDLPKSSKKSFYIMRYNTLLQDKILLTIKRSTSSQKFMYARESGEVKIGKNYHENTTDISIGSYLFKYNYENSYNYYGGFTYEIDLQNWDENKLPQEVQSVLIDEMLQYVTLEFIFENTDYKALVYNSITIVADVGAYKQVDFSISMFNYMPFDTWLDQISVISEIIFAAFLIYLIFEFFYTIKIRSKKYDKWYRDTVRNLHGDILDLRENYLPEYLRKIQMVFGFEQLFDLLLLGLSCWLLYLGIRYYILQIYMGDLYVSLSMSTLDIYKIRSTIYDAVDIRNTYLNLSCILIFCNSMRFLISLKLGGYFTLLISTLKRSQIGNISFLIILLLILPGYIIYMYLAFGDSMRGYSNISDTIINSFVALFGDLNFMGFYNSENFFGPLLVINFSFLIQMLLVNCFVAVIYVSYQKIKETFRTSNEKFSLKRTFLFCCYRNRGILHSRNKKIIEEDMIFSLNPNYYHWNSELKFSNLDENFENLDIEVVKFKRFNDEINLTQEKLRDFTDAYECKQLNVISSITKDYNYPDVDSDHLKIYEILTLKRYLDYCSTIKIDQRDLENEIQETKYQYEQKMSNYSNNDSNQIKISPINLETERKIKEEINDLTADIDTLKEELNKLRNR